jgi:hypothetical protein
MYKEECKPHMGEPEETKKKNCIKINIEGNEHN